MIKTQTGDSTAASFIQAEYLDGERGFTRFREGTAEVAEATLRDAPDGFRAHSKTRHLGSAVTVDVTSSPVIFEHSATHVARTGLDHYMVTMYMSGGCEFAAGSRATIARAGDIFIVDYSEPNLSRIFGSSNGVARALNIVLPRRQLAPLLAAPDAVQASVIRRESAAGKLVGEHMMALNQPMLGPAAAEAEHRLAELTHLLAQGIGPTAASDPRLARQALLSTIKRHINRHLEADIDIAHLCHRFGLSRSTLYRLFEPEGGITAYIQQRRLIRAFTLLLAPQTRNLRIIDVAIDNHFASDATFIRAFRRLFGRTPGEVRALAMEQEKLIKRSEVTSWSSTDTLWIQELARRASGNA